MRLTYLVGEPGAGKTSLAAQAIVGPVIELAKPFAHRVAADGVVHLGPAGPEPFGGTDRLSMSVQPRVLAWLRSDTPERVFGEGDRLGTASFLRAARQEGYETALVILSVPADVAADRRARRSVQHDTGAQNEGWLAGRRTKIANLRREAEALRLVDELHVLDGMAGLLTCADRLRAIIG